MKRVFGVLAIVLGLEFISCASTGAMDNTMNNLERTFNMNEISIPELESYGIDLSDSNVASYLNSLGWVYNIEYQKLMPSAKQWKEWKRYGGTSLMLGVLGVPNYDKMAKDVVNPQTRISMELYVKVNDPYNTEEVPSLIGKWLAIMNPRIASKLN